MINLNHLKYFYLCAQSENLTQAAQTLGITQPALSMQVKQFEDSLGFKLFSRSSKRFALTPKGKELYQYSARLFEVSAEIDLFLKNIESAEELNIKLGVSEEVERPFIAEVAGRLTKSHHGKKLSVLILSKSHDEIARLMQNENLDFIITNKEIRGGLKMILKLEMPVQLAVSGNATVSGFATGSQSASKILNSVEMDMILPDEDLVLGKETKKFLRQHRIKKHVSISSNIVSCLVRSVQEDAGIAFLPTPYLSKEIKRGTIRVMGPRQGFWSHSLYVYSQKSDRSNLAESLTKIIQDLSVLT